MVDLASVTKKLILSLEPLQFGAPVTHVYNPLVYAGKPHFKYIEKYGQGAREIILLGMNPGPWGMAQTGVPFGDTPSVRDWLGIEESVGKPADEHPKRPVQGFACKKREVSGKRLWGWAQRNYGTPEKFFKRFYVINYCPLCFMEESGKNFTPDKIPVAERDPLLKICDNAFRQMVETMQPKYVIGVGGFAEKRAKMALEGMKLIIGSIPHPSPANPAANNGWADLAAKGFEKIGIVIP